MEHSWASDWGGPTTRWASTGCVTALANTPHPHPTQHEASNVHAQHEHNSGKTLTHSSHSKAGCHPHEVCTTAPTPIMLMLCTRGLAPPPALAAVASGCAPFSPQGHRIAPAAHACNSIAFYKSRQGSCRWYSCVRACRCTVAAGFTVKAAHNT